MGLILQQQQKCLSVKDAGFHSQPGLVIELLFAEEGDVTGLKNDL